MALARTRTAAVAFREIEPLRTHETDTKLSQQLADVSRTCIRGPSKLIWVRWPASSKSLMDKSPSGLVKVTSRFRMSAGNAHRHRVGGPLLLRKTPPIPRPQASWHPSVVASGGRTSIMWVFLVANEWTRRRQSSNSLCTLSVRGMWPVCSSSAFCKWQNRPMPRARYRRRFSKYPAGGTISWLMCVGGAAEKVLAPHSIFQPGLPAIPP
jgi:hypothetical protein